MNETAQATLSEMLEKPGPARYDGRVALSLGAGGAIASLLLLPYALAMTQAAPPSGGRLLLIFAANFVFISSFAWIGLRAGERFGLDSPRIRGRIAGNAGQKPSHWILAIVAGIVAAIAACLLQLALPLPVDSIDMSRMPVWWKGLSASFYGGIVEETISRLFLVSVLVWLAARICRPGPAVHWAAIVIAALLFGAAHQPNWSARLEKSSAADVT